MALLKKYLMIVIAVVLSGGFAYAQKKPAASSTPTPLPSPQGRAGERDVPFNLSDYGASFQTDTRLIVVMAALDAAGFDPTPAGKEPSVFRARVKKDQA